MIRMAKMKAKMPDELIAKLSRLGQKTDEVCEKALQAGAEVAKSAISANLSAVIGKGTKKPSRSSGQPPKPFLKPAKSKARKQIMAAMTDTLEREMNDV